MAGKRDGAGMQPRAKATTKATAKATGKRKSKFPIGPVIGLAIGLLILAAPIFSNLYSNWQNSTVVSTMTSSASANTQQASELLSQAYAYNASLAGTSYDSMRGSALDELRADSADRGDGEEIPSVGGAPASVNPYGLQLSTDDEAMAWVDIPKINVKLPVYHGTSDVVLAAGSGHLEGTSLPVGGASTHTVLTAHSGTHAQMMFDDIRLLEVGDVFSIHTLGHEYSYEVYGIETVLPEETSSLAVQPGEDLCTLVTCTPYGVNDHRLLIHAKRTTALPTQPTVADTLQQALGIRFLPFIIAAVLVAILAAVLIRRKRRRKGHAAQDSLDA